MRYEIRQGSDGAYRIHDTNWPKAPAIAFGRISDYDLARKIADHLNGKGGDPRGEEERQEVLAPRPRAGRRGLPLK